MSDHSIEELAAEQVVLDSKITQVASSLSTFIDEEREYRGRHREELNGLRSAQAEGFNRIERSIDNRAKAAREEHIAHQQPYWKTAMMVVPCVLMLCTAGVYYFNFRDDLATEHSHQEGHVSGIAKHATSEERLRGVVKEIENIHEKITHFDAQLQMEIDFAQKESASRHDSQGEIIDALASRINREAELHQRINDAQHKALFWKLKAGAKDE